MQLLCKSFTTKIHLIVLDIIFFTLFVLMESSLSINIPVYNYDVIPLVQQLCKQAAALPNAIEIRVYDDNSNLSIKRKNRKVASRPHVVYYEMPQNVGRSAIRNKMGMESKNDLLLFIDADSEITKPDYLKCFITNFRHKYIICGGGSYSETKPTDIKKLLHWYYGKNREAIAADIRNKEKKFILTSNNFLIEKQVFEKIHFREAISKYGHEDTLLGYDLSQKGYMIYHINNPTKHTGLEDAESFLIKTKLALNNLLKINNQILFNDTIFNKQVKLLNKYKQITKFLPEALIRSFYKIFHKQIETNLCGKRPSIFLYDLYKLGYYATIKKGKQ